MQAPMARVLELPLLLAVSITFPFLAWGNEEHQYCIIGGGPAGIQLGHFFFHGGRDYVLFEKNPRAGSFFEKYPRHRNLISVNKRNVREGRGEDFAFRHDWNTLIDVRSKADRPKPMTSRSKELFPKADILAGYLREFAEEQAQHIHYNADVTKISRKKDSNGFNVMVNAKLFQCKEVIVATGFNKARPADSRIDGIEHITLYSDMPETGESFAGKSVFVLGQGNAAMETVQELQKYTAEVHLYSRARPLPQGGKGVRMAYETHYVGDIRAGRTGILDTYLLKSLDTFCHDCLTGDSRLLILPCQGRKCIFEVDENECVDEQCRKKHKLGAQKLNYRLPIAAWPVDHPKGEEVRRMLQELGAGAESEDTWQIEEVKDDPTDKNGIPKDISPDKKKRWKKMASRVDLSVFEGKREELTINSKILRENPKVMDYLADVRAGGGHSDKRFPMDAVIVAFGWVMDISIFDESLQSEVAMTHNRKYPALTPSFEVKSTSEKPIPGLYVAGTIGHGLDFRKSAGGFIHGFRYTARVLFNHLEEKNFGVSWPTTKFVNLQRNLEWDPHETKVCIAAPSPANACGAPGKSTLMLFERLVTRINEASGPYQMFGFLGDMVVFEKNSTTGSWAANYMEDVPLDSFQKTYRSSPRLIWSFKYADDFYGPKVLSDRRVGTDEVESAHMSNFLHPYIRFYPANSDNSTKSHYLIEDIYTHWRCYEDIFPFGNWMNQVVEALSSSN
eukprot:TRINITY_DN7072_c0_g1_i2.p1 TRINITY_DN7072_c0_g1~~TRINITY_DN7072_c0_g1_i2.p1  ORF type:complete len:732 (-),score=116.15 TRINITY_DN7072_c0_g1_i2:291-2486(-)